MSLPPPGPLSVTLALPWWARRAGLIDLIEIVTARLERSRDPAVALAMAEAVAAVATDERQARMAADRVAAELDRAKEAFARWPKPKRRRALRRLIELMPIGRWGDAARGLRAMDVVPAAIVLWGDGWWSAADVGARAARAGVAVDPQIRPAVVFPVFSYGLGADPGAQRLVDLVAVTLDAQPVAATFVQKRALIGPYGGDIEGVAQGTAALTANALEWARARLQHGLNAARPVECREPVPRVDLVRDLSLLAGELRATYGLARTITTPFDSNIGPASFPALVRKALGPRAGRVVVMAAAIDQEAAA